VHFQEHLNDGQEKHLLPIRHDIKPGTLSKPKPVKVVHASGQPFFFTASLSLSKAIGATFDKLRLTCMSLNGNRLTRNGK